MTFHFVGQWVGSVSELLTSLTDALRAHVFAADVVHTDDTPLPVLALWLGKTKTGRLRTYVRDERPAGGGGAAAVWFAYSPDRKGEHPQRHLADFSGILQADVWACILGVCTICKCSANYFGSLTIACMSVAVYCVRADN